MSQRTAHRQRRQMDKLRKRLTGWMIATTQNKPQQILPSVGTVHVDKDNVETHLNSCYSFSGAMHLSHPTRLLGSDLFFFDKHCRPESDISAALLLLYH